MATGALDANGIWQYGEDDSETTFSALLNKLGSSTSTEVGELRAGAPIAVADAAGRTAQFPSPVHGNAVFRKDLGYVERYYGLYNVSTNPGGLSVAGWYRDFGRGQKAVLGEGIRNNAATNYVLTTGYTDLPDLSVSATTSGLPVKISVTVTIKNANSGASRYAYFRIQQGATQLTELAYVSVYLNTSSDHTSVTFFHKFTPTAATSTFKVQGIASTASAVSFVSGQILVEEMYQ